jgi:hypothetical protein
MRNVCEKNVWEKNVEWCPQHVTRMAIVIIFSCPPTLDEINMDSVWTKHSFLFECYKTLLFLVFYLFNKNLFQDDATYVKYNISWPYSLQISRYFVNSTSQNAYQTIQCVEKVKQHAILDPSSLHICFIRCKNSLVLIIMCKHIETEVCLFCHLLYH